MTAGRDDPYEVKVIREVRVPTAEPGVTLAADAFLPDTTENVPALVTLVPYRKDAWAGLNYQAPMRSFAERGYACLLVDLRGTGSSDGVLRSTFDAGEADDAVAAIEWAAAQPWCDGNVGMWGLSHAATAALRAASRHPPALKAIVPAMAAVDPERDWVHPRGARGGLASLGSWAAHNLKLQLLPPLAQYDSPDEQRRWRQRLRDTDYVAPYIVDMFRHGAGDPSWRERSVDASAVDIPTLCIGGWRDVFCAPTVRAFEQVTGPKRLVVGPWTHTLPHRAAAEPVDFFALAGRWWDRWLHGIENGVEDEPGVLIHVPGAGWRAFDTWSPSTHEMVMSTADEDRLTPSSAEYQPDPTTGVLSGLWFAGIAGVGTPLDQHDDDSRAASLTGEPRDDELILVGQPTVQLAVQVATASSKGSSSGGDEPAPRVVVRLADVDPDGRSTFITSGIASGLEDGQTGRVVLDPTAYRVPAGHRLRVVISNADFPRLWPQPHAFVLRISDVRLELPALDQDLGTGAEPPRPRLDATALPAMAAWEKPRWTITRDPIADAVDVVVGRDVVTRTPDGANLLESHQEGRASVRKNAPEIAEVQVTDNVTVRMLSGTRIDVAVTAHLTRSGLDARGDVSVDGTAMFSRTWSA